MERIQFVSGHHEGAGAACVVCEATLDAARCGHCGAAVAPGGYRVQRLISQSVHGRVYLAVDPAGQRVALKELLFALVPGVEQLEAFEREAAVLRSLSHPDIPRFVASFQEGSGVGTRLYLAQEYLEGESLLQRIERQRLDEDAVWTLAGQVLQTLHALHQRTPALIHRDVKPANLILRPDGRAALVDFGAARHLARDVTHGSTLVGTFGYMPPEQLGGTVEPSSDLYALGATLVHALTGRMPADLLDDGLALSFEQHVQGSESLRAFLRRLLAPKRSARFGSAAEALAAWRAARVMPSGAPGEASGPGRSAVAGRGGADPRAQGECLVTQPVPNPGAAVPLAHEGSTPPEAVAQARAADAGVSVPLAGEGGGPAPREAATQAQVADAGVSVPLAGEGGGLAPREAATQAQAAKAVGTEAVPALSKRRLLRWALVGVSVGALLVGSLLASGILEPRTEVVITDPPDSFAPPQQTPPPSRPAPPSGNGSHRTFRTAWPGSSSSSGSP